MIEPISDSVAERVRMESSWKQVLYGEFQAPYFPKLTAIIRDEYKRGIPRCYPPAKEIFAAFDCTPFDEVKVVIMGQDPYHGSGQANGLAFSVRKGVQIPPSLRNIFKEVHDDIGAPIPADGDLTRWARQGVLLLNSSLTVREHEPRSHAGIGWERLTEAAVRNLAEKRDNLVFMLWGSDAIRRGEFIDRSRNLVLTSVHPSPLSASRGFFGNHHFSQANKYLVEHGKTPIEW